MKVYFVNDTSSWHNGSQATCRSLKERIQSAGHVIHQVCYRPDGPIPRLIDECDFMIINGEGTFRNELSNPENGRLTLLREGMKHAVYSGKQVFLVNTLWYNMLPGWRNILKNITGISTREPMSANYMRESQTYAIYPDIHPEEAYFYYVKDDNHRPFEGMNIVGDFYPWNTKEGITHNDELFKDMPRLSMFELCWKDLVNQLRGAKLYITGLHHGVIAACKARVPFACCEVRTWKIKGLFQWAGVEIPLANDMESLKSAIRFAYDRPEEFEKLFNFLENQTPWPIPR